MSRVDRTRAATLLEAAGLDALVVAAPEAFRYVTGARPGPAALFRRAGAALAVLPADPALPIAAVTTELGAGAVAAAAITDIRTIPDWVDTVRLGPDDGRPLAAQIADARPSQSEPKPETFSARSAFAALGSALTARGLARGRLGLDLGFWPVADFRVLCEALPAAQLLPGDTALMQLRAVKSTAEQGWLAAAGRCAEAGLATMLKEVRPSLSRGDLATAWRHGAGEAAAREGVVLESLWEYIGFGPDPWRSPGPLTAGDILKADVGCVVEGYSSDSARTFSLGTPAPRAQAAHDALAAGFAAGLSMFRPSVRFADIHRAVVGAVRNAGLPGYDRGHVGHALGADVFGETAPFLSATSAAVVEPGMVLAFETPLYADGMGGLIIEDQLAISESGPEPLWQMPHGLVAL
jgi:Xaa-Pro aminopeptidase